MTYLADVAMALFVVFSFSFENDVLCRFPMILTVTIKYFINYNFDNYLLCKVKFINGVVRKKSYYSYMERKLNL